MDLLSAADREEIKSAVHDVTDTFFKMTIEYFRASSSSMDRFQEDRPDTRSAPPIALTGKVSYFKDNGAWGKELPVGMLPEAKVKVTLNMQDLPAGLVDATTNLTVFKEGGDWFSINGQQYKVLFVYHGANMDTQNMLVKLFGQIR